MKGITEKCRQIEELKEEIDSHIWSIFSRYIKEEKILFNMAEDYQIQYDSIYFYGQDGCRGCYDNMSLSIPMEFFEDPDNAFAKRKAERDQKKREEEEKKRLAEEERERKQLQRLREKYDE